jgi:hypothetical protein
MYLGQVGCLVGLWGLDSDGPLAFDQGRQNFPRLGRFVND